ncbi:hypothetical protein OG233_13985 [Streptomyces sp. NBC_01218]|uniref:hypothetical protein n=1 Tax=Streptomyces sp. NBC_01218 TaxID=2903780 RepID=UPI002E15FFEF|nr:hypothetical protein OG233_13985 [Streptomyces sp. NBC_01218]
MTDMTDADAKAICAALGVNTKTITDAFGRAQTVIDEAGMRKLADHAPIGATAAHALTDQLLATARSRQERPLARIRTDVVSILIGLDLRGEAECWAHRDGQPLTGDERELVMSATQGEFLAAAEETTRLLAEERKQVAALRRIRELVGPYFATLPANSTMAEVMPLMSEAERSELRVLASTLPPDGTVIVPPAA